MHQPIDEVIQKIPGIRLGQAPVFFRFLDQGDEGLVVHGRRLPRLVLAHQARHLARERLQVHLGHKNLEMARVFARYLQVKGSQLLSGKLVVQFFLQPQHRCRAHEQIAHVRVGGADGAVIVAERAAVVTHQLLQCDEVCNVAGEFRSSRFDESLAQRVRAQQGRGHAMPRATRPPPAGAPRARPGTGRRKNRSPWPR